MPVESSDTRSSVRPCCDNRIAAARSSPRRAYTAAARSTTPGDGRWPSVRCSLTGSAISPHPSGRNRIGRPTSSSTSSAPGPIACEVTSAESSGRCARSRTMLAGPVRSLPASCRSIELRQGARPCGGGRMPADRQTSTGQHDRRRPPCGQAVQGVDHVVRRPAGGLEPTSGDRTQHLGRFGEVEPQIVGGDERARRVRPPRAAARSRPSRRPTTTTRDGGAHRSTSPTSQATDAADARCTSSITIATPPGRAASASRERTRIGRRRRRRRDPTGRSYAARRARGAHVARFVDHGDGDGLVAHRRELAGERGLAEPSGRLDEHHGGATGATQQAVRAAPVSGRSAPAPRRPYRDAGATAKGEP